MGADPSGTRLDGGPLEVSVLAPDRSGRGQRHQSTDSLLEVVMQKTELQLPAELSNIQPFQHWGSFIVKSEADVELAGGAIKEIEGQLKAIKAKQTELFGPLKKAIRDFEEKVREVTGPLTILSKTLRGRVTFFWNEREAKLKAEAEAKRKADLAEEKRKQKAAEALAMTTGDETALKEVEQRTRNVAKLETTPVKVSQTVKTSSFTLAQSKVGRWRVIDEKLIPDEFWILDEKALNKLAKGRKPESVDIPGIEFYEEKHTNLR
jgi:hypothetical protein